MSRVSSTTSVLPESRRTVIGSATLAPLLLDLGADDRAADRADDGRCGIAAAAADLVANDTTASPPSTVPTLTGRLSEPRKISMASTVPSSTGAGVSPGEVAGRGNDD
jgi:hypothetical protein